MKLGTDEDLKTLANDERLSGRREQPCCQLQQDFKLKFDIPHIDGRLQIEKMHGLTQIGGNILRMYGHNKRKDGQTSIV